MRKHTNKNGPAVGGSRRGPQTPKEGTQMNDNSIIAQFPDIEKIAAEARPAWADPSLTFFGGDMVGYRRNIGDMTIEQDYAIEDMVFRPLGVVEVSFHAIVSDNNVVPAANTLGAAINLLQAFDIYNSTALEPPITVEQQPRQSDQTQAEWLAAHADSIAAVQPAWADSTRTEVDFDDDDGTVESIMFSRQVGTVAIEQMFFPDNGFGTPYAAGEPQVWEDDNGPKPIGQATVVGTDLIKAAQILNGPGEVTPSMFEIVANALGVLPVDLYALAHVDKDPENDVSLGDLSRVARYIGISPTELYNQANRVAPDKFDVESAEEYINFARDIVNKNICSIYVEQFNDPHLSRGEARAIGLRLLALADEWDRA